MINSKIISLIAIIGVVGGLGIFFGVTTDYNADTQITSNSFPIVSTQASLILYPFEGFVKNSPIVAVATVQSVETKLVDTSRSIARTVMADGYQEAFDDMINAQWNDDDYDGPNSIELYMQYATDEIIETIQEEHMPFQFVTLSVDKYIKDETGKFADTLIIFSDANGEGTRNNEPYNFYSYSAVDYNIGEKSLYLISELNSETRTAIGKITDDEILFGHSGFSDKYDVQNDGTVLSKYNQYFLKHYDYSEVSEMRQLIESDSIDSKKTAIPRSITLNLPISSLDEAIRSAEQIVNSTGNE